MSEGILIALVGFGATFVSGGMTFLLMRGKTRSEMQLNQLEGIQKTLDMYNTELLKADERATKYREETDCTIKELKDNIATLRRIITSLFALSCKMKGCKNRVLMSDDELGIICKKDDERTT